MPKKGRRVAARQAQLGQKKQNRQGEGTQREMAIKARLPTRPQPESTALGGPDGQRVASGPAFVRRSQAATKEPRLTPLSSSDYILSDLIRIGLLSALVVAILVALTFILR